MERQPNTIYAASVSRGKDSTAMLEAIRLLGYPLDAIYAVDIWATDDIPAELPPMVAFKDEWDRKAFKRYGIPVTRLCARNKDGSKKTYESLFYRKVTPQRLAKRRVEYSIPRGIEDIYGFPLQRGPWCNGYLKRDVLGQASSHSVQYIGIAADEAERVSRWGGRQNVVLPLVDIGWDEAKCREVAETLGMLSPVYTTGARDGCWFCHNQGIDQLRRLRQGYPALWAKLLEWDNDSPFPFKADGHTVHDFERRFQAEDEGYIQPGDTFKWDDLNNLQSNIFQFLGGDDADG